MAPTAAPSSAPGQAKRKASAAGLSSSGRTVKRRASKACHCCRSRKVRCDVVESGIPCTNCRLDEVECIVTEGKRRRKSYADGDMFHQSPCNSIEEEKEIPQFPLFDDIDGFQDLSQQPAVPDATAVSYDNATNALEFDMLHHKPHMLCKSESVLFSGLRFSDIWPQTKPRAIVSAQRNALVAFPRSRPKLSSPLLYNCSVDPNTSHMLLVVLKSFCHILSTPFPQES